VAIERREKTAGSMRLIQIPNATRSVLNSFVENSIRPKQTTVFTDAWGSYTQDDERRQEAMAAKKSQKKKAATKKSARKEGKSAGRKPAAGRKAAKKKAAKPQAARAAKRGPARSGDTPEDSIQSLAKSFAARDLR